MLVLQNQLSGNLLRKFKNSSGWQKLWVVFTNFCLFFYKSHQVRAAPRAASRSEGGGLPPEGRRTGHSSYPSLEKPPTPRPSFLSGEGSPVALERATGCWLNTGGGTCLRARGPCRPHGRPAGREAAASHPPPPGHRSKAPFC